MPPQTRSYALRPCPDWNNSESELTDLTDSEDEEEVPEPTSQRKQGPRPPPSEDKGNELPSSSSRPGRTTRQATQKLVEEGMCAVNDSDQAALPEFSQMPTKISDVYDWMCEGMVDICPDYQRDVVWNDAKQMNLIDSIFQNYPVPNLVFLRRRQNGEYYRVCIDGKQRLTSIKRFMDGEIYWKDPVTKKKLWYKKTQPNQRRFILSDLLKRQFRWKPLTIYDYEGITLNQERMIFQRVQLGTVLTPAERLQAVNGVCGSLVREIREHICSFKVFSDFSEWGGNRGRDFLALSQIVYLVKGGKLPATLPEPDKLTPFLEGKVGDIDRLRDGIKHSFTIFARLLSHPHYGKVLTEKDISPVEFVVGVHAIFSLGKQLTDCQLADALKKIWGNARDKSTVKRKATKSSSIKAYGDMRNFLERVLSGKISLERSETEHLAAFDVPRDYGLDMNTQLEEIPKVEAGPSTSRKRSRAQASRDADDDDHETPPAKATTQKKPTSFKKQKLAHRAKRDAADSDDDMDSDGSAEIVSAVPKRAAASGSTMKKPSQVGKSPTASAAATRVRRAPASTARDPLPKASGSASRASTSATVKKPTVNTASSRVPEDRKVLRQTAPRSSSTQSFATALSSASPRNTPGASSASTAKPNQPRGSRHTTPSTNNNALPRLSPLDVSFGNSHGPNSAASGSGSTSRMERLQMLKNQSKPDSQSSTPPLPPGPKLPTPAPDEPIQKLGSLPPLTRNAPAPQPTAGSSRLPPPPWQTSASTSAASLSGVGSGSESVLGTLQAKRGDLSGLKFSKTPTEPPGQRRVTQKTDLPTPPLPSRVPGAGFAISGVFGEQVPPLPSRSSPVAQQSASSAASRFVSNPAGFGMERKSSSGARTLPTPPTSSSYIWKEPREGGQ